MDLLSGNLLTFQKGNPALGAELKPSKKLPCRVRRAVRSALVLSEQIGYAKPIKAEFGRR
jgi:hypothetical protein